MKWGKKLWSIVTVFILLFSFMGCIVRGNDPLVILTELEYRTKVDSAVSYMKQKYPELEMEVEYLISSGEERENQVQKLRTQIMAEKGPDVYLLDGVSLNYAESRTPLFENPYKTMQSGALASLDRYMKKDSYWKESTYRKDFLKAGRYKEKQYLIPLSCNYQVLVMNQKDTEDLKNKNLAEWLTVAEDSENIRLKKLMNILHLSSSEWIKGAADYENKEVSFDQNAWKEFYMDQNLFRRAYFEQVDGGSSGSYSEITSETKEVLAVPDINGKKLAAVQAFGAVGMSSDHKEEAYEFLMLFLNDEAQTELTKQGLGTFLNGTIDTAIPVQESALAVCPMLLSFDETQMGYVKASYEELEGVYFYTNTDRLLDEEATSASSRFDDPDADFTVWEATASKLAEWAYNNYEMEISE